MVSLVANIVTKLVGYVLPMYRNFVLMGVTQRLCGWFGLTIRSTAIMAAGSNIIYKKL